MTETATINSPQSKDDFKAFFLQLLEEDAAFYNGIKNKLQIKEENVKKKPRKPLPPPIPFSEMLYRKLHPDFKPLDATPYAIKKEIILELQELWKGELSAEEIIDQL